MALGEVDHGGAQQVSRRSVAAFRVAALCAVLLGTAVVMSRMEDDATAKPMVDAQAKGLLGGAPSNSPQLSTISIGAASNHLRRLSCIYKYRCVDHLKKPPAVKSPFLPSHSAIPIRSRMPDPEIALRSRQPCQSSLPRHRSVPWHREPL